MARGNFVDISRIQEGAVQFYQLRVRAPRVEADVPTVLTPQENLTLPCSGQVAWQEAFRQPGRYTRLEPKI